MSTAVLEFGRGAGRGDSRQSRLFDDLRRAGPRESGPPGSEAGGNARGERDPRSGGDRLSLEARLESIWEGLLAAGAAECPVCTGRMTRSGDGGECRTCHAQLL